MVDFFDDVGKILYLLAKVLDIFWTIPTVNFTVHKSYFFTDFRESQQIPIYQIFKSSLHNLLSVEKAVSSLLDGGLLYLVFIIIHEFAQSDGTSVVSFLLSKEAISVQTHHDKFWDVIG